VRAVQQFAKEQNLPEDVIPALFEAWPNTACFVTSAQPPNVTAVGATNTFLNALQLLLWFCP
jgi:hypothetical protein